MKSLLCVVICVCLLQVTLVESGAIIEKIKSGASKVKQGVHCGFHKAKSVFVEHEHIKDPCDFSSHKLNGKLLVFLMR